MMNKKTLFKQLKFFCSFIAIATISPIILAKLGFWGDSQAAVKFQKANAPINYTSATPSFAEAIARALPAVVSIQSTKERSVDNLYCAIPCFDSFLEMHGKCLKYNPVLALGDCY